MKPELIDVSVEEGVWATHLKASFFGYNTLCGLDGHDGEAGQAIRPAPIGAKINCATCATIIEACKGISRYVEKDTDKLI